MISTKFEELLEKGPILR